MKGKFGQDTSLNLPLSTVVLANKGIKESWKGRIAGIGMRLLYNKKE